MWSRSRRLAPVLAALVFLAAGARAGVANDFSDYPLDAQDCMYRAADASKCDGETVPVMNGCLCSNGGGFVLKTASCLAASDEADLGAVYDALQVHCSDSRTPLDISRAKFVSAKPDSTTTRSPTSTSTGGSKPTATGPQPTATGGGSNGGNNHNGNNNDGGSSGNDSLSTGAKIGIAAGSVAAGCGLLGLGIFWALRQRRRRRAGREEAHPMLAHKLGSPGAPPGGGGRGKGNGPDKWRTSQGFSWESPYEPPWNGPPSAGQMPAQWGAPTPSPPIMGPPPAAHYGQQSPGLVPSHGVFELSGGDAMAPSEVPATPVAHSQVPYSGAGWGATRGGN